MDSSHSQLSEGSPFLLAKDLARWLDQRQWAPRGGAGSPARLLSCLGHCRRSGSCFPSKFLGNAKANAAVTGVTALAIPADNSAQWQLLELEGFRAQCCSRLCVRRPPAQLLSTNDIRVMLSSSLIAGADDHEAEQGLPRHAQRHFQPV